MASLRVILLTVFFQFILFSFTCLAMNNTTSPSEAPKVRLALYYQSICPACSMFIVNSLSTIFENDRLIDIIDLHLVPYGNAQVSKNITITCQHGDFECFVNTMEACAINVWPDVNKHFKYIYCAQKLVMEDKEMESCSGKDFDERPISDCYQSGLGEKLELQYGNETDTLNPPHPYVPWVTVDGKPLHMNYENFKTYVCNAYKGTPPIACQSTTQLETVVKTSSAQIAQVCYAKEEKSPTKTKIKSLKYLFGGAK